MVIALFSRRAAGWSLRQDMACGNASNAQRMAWFKRHPVTDAGLIFNSDRGSESPSQDFRTLLAGYGITASMSRTGKRWDNLSVRLCSARSKCDGCTDSASQAGVRPPMTSSPGGALVQPDAMAPDAGLRQPDAVRRRLLRRPTPAGQRLAQPADTEFRGKVRAFIGFCQSGGGAGNRL